MRINKLWVIILAVLGVFAFGQPSVANADTVALSLVMDGSGSISSSNWTLQLDGYADAITDPTVMPFDSTVAINVIQFSSSVVEEIGFTVIDSATTANALATAIQGISQMGYTTNIAGGIDLGLSTLQAFDNPRSYDKWIIDVSTDGAHNQSGNPTTSANAARAAGVDAVNALRVGSATTTPWADNEWYVSSYTQFGAIVKDKIKAEIHGVPEPGMLLLLGTGLIAMACWSRNAIRK